MNRLLAITARHWQYLLGLNVILMTGAVASVKYSQKVWTATTQFILPDSTSNLDASLGTLGSIRNSDPGFSAQVNPLKIQASILTSDALIEQVLASDLEKSQFKGIASYKGLFKVSPQEQSTIISVSVSGSSPEIARSRALTLTSAYQKRLNELRQANSEARLQFSQKELRLAKERLTEAQTRLAGFRQSTGLANVEEQTKGIVSTINTLTTARATALAQAAASQNRAQIISQRLNLMPTQAVQSLSLGENQDYQFVRNKLAEVEAALVQKRATLTENHPQVQSLITQSQQLQSLLQEYINSAGNGNRIDTTVTTDAQGRSTLIQQLILADSEATAQKQQAEKLDNQILQLNATLKSLPASQQKLTDLQRQVDVAEGVYKGLVAQVQQNNIDAFNAYPNVQVFDPPRVEPKPTSPKMSLALINAVLASIIGSIALLLLLEKRNPLLSPKDLEAVKFRFVARIPKLKNSTIPSQLGQEREIEFQRLASTISLQPLENHRLLITSAMMGEGKTTVTIGLAIALVDLGFRVLLVDGDVRQAQLSKRLGFSVESIPNLQLMPIQPNLDLLPMPQQGTKVQLLRRGRFEQLLATAESTNNYDYVLIDSAPVSLTSETAMMAAHANNVLFVVRPGVSHSHSVNESIEQLIQHKAQMLALVVNGEETKTKTYPNRLNTSVLE
ncbi:GumC family protein [Iningainema tapete]|uniref:non-specific protein-tyrosine kinase n=1 Tax=Iningainema tapete BLCC-T55 TaxID=2748662 RepID=A0A8J6XU81_9CYAN|nr:polysaccharide biosynthesis tyrosine autokinase [Iningainema tapete]MBD2776047.1 AAA family ATPase [Iningainema tapete BLCC-T55]